ncbi:MAG: ribonuclease J [Ardenticatenaceae bacterium]|nr:ribonuclease J [Anaerolineales bacterium]MCB8918268.1 ribonuclease J [Ardenticatenaceae bacterium]
MSSKLRIVPLGGLGEIGKNMTVIEYEDEILIIDAGIMFPENDMLGVDAIIPDYEYVRENRDKVKAILITHGHEDHVGALPYLMREVDVPIYATPLTIGLIEVKLREAKLLQDVTLKTIQAGFNFRLGSFNIEPFHVAHSIPDCVGFGITTPVGLIVHTGDYKFDHTPVDNWPPDFAKLAEFSKRGVLALLADSTNAERPGWTPSEQVITAAFDDLFSQAEGRVIVASFASLISRIQQVGEAAAKHGRKLAITGRSMRNNVKIAQRLGYLELPPDLLIDISEVSKLPAHRVTVMATGSQGEPTAVLGRLATGRHRQLSVQEGDTVVMSAHPIPGNEEMIYRIINRLFQRGANVLYNQVAQVHVSGHASQEEMKLMINLVRPKFLIPVHGELRHLRQHAAMARNLGIHADNIAVVENGTVLELDEHSLKVQERIPGGYVYVDGAGVGDIGHSILRDREKLANGGFVVAIVNVSPSGALIGKPQFVSRGFTDLESSNGLLSGAEKTIAQMAGMQWSSKDELTNRLTGALNRYFYSEIGRRPVVDVVLK